MGKRQTKLKPAESKELVKTTHCELKIAFDVTYNGVYSVPTVTAKELDQWYKHFMKDCPTGALGEKVRWIDQYTSELHQSTDGPTIHD